VEADLDYRLLFEYATQGVFVADPNGWFIDANEHGLAMLGYRLEELRELSMGDLLVPEERMQRPARIDELRAGKTVVSQRWLQCGDGTRLRAEISGRALPDGSFLGIMRDVTDEWRTEQALRESEERYRTLVESSPAGILIFQGDRFVYVNPALASLVGYSQDELCRLDLKGIGELIHPDDRSTWLARVHARLGGEPAPSRYEVRLLSRSGAVRWVELTSNRIDYQSAPALQATVTDVSERKYAEEELAERERYFRSLIESASDTIVVLSPDTTVRYVSPAIEQLTGYSPEEFEGMPPSSLAPMEDIPRIRETLEEVFSNPEHTLSIGGRIGHRDGTWREVEAAARALVEGDHVTGIVIAMRDVSDRAELEKQLVRAQKMEAVGRLAGGVAHDFNNMITVIMSQATLVQRKPELAERSVREIQSAAERAAALVKQLLAFSRRQVVRPTVFRVAEVVRDLGPILEKALGEHIDFDCDVQDETACVLADRGQVEQVLVNLAVNARDAMPEGGTVQVIASRRRLAEGTVNERANLAPGDYAAISVVDDGLGMTPEVKERLFDPFFTTKESGKGTGLGLATCYGIVTRFEGDIEVYSEYGRGTRVVVLLPLTEQSPQSEAAEGAEEELPGGQESILIVENDTPLREAAARMIEGLGYNVYTAPEGTHALEWIRQGTQVDLVFTDVVMPKMAGRELVERLRSERPDLPVLLTSGHLNDPGLQEQFERQELPFLPKPYTLGMLARALRRVLDEGR
jgi:PAS domain S-box-containing protein